MNSFETLIQQALAEDIGSGDHTSLACIPSKAEGTAQILSKSEGILAGLSVVKQVYREVDPEVRVESFLEDGQPYHRGDCVAHIQGLQTSILAGERVALNYLQRMSGIATHTRHLVDLLAGTSTRLLDTRKTTPNNRIFEKMAVALGGGCNHRSGLYDMILIKDNHIDFAGGIPQALDACMAYLKVQNLPLKVEIEVRHLDDIDRVLQHGGVDRIMLDNFSLEDLVKAVKKIDHQVETEASGGITEESIRAYARTGVDYISVGALTHHIHSLDFSLLVRTK